MDFEPLTEIWFCHTGIDEFNKVVVDGQSTLFTALTSGTNLVGQTKANSFQRGDGFFLIRVDHTEIPYYDLLNADTVLYANRETTREFYIVGNIISVEWKNPDCSFVRFKIDHFMTYQTFIDWESSWAYVEREHVKNDWTAGGSRPLFTNIGPAEDFNVEPDTPIFTKEFTFTPSLVMVQSPYDNSGEAVFSGSTVGNLFTSLQNPIFGETAANAYFERIAEKTEASINNIVGVYGVPSAFIGPIQAGVPYERDENLPPVEESNETTFTIEYNNAKCWSAPFCIIKLASSQGSSLVFNPQWFGNNASNYKLKIKATGAGGQFGGVAATFDNAAGAFDWKNWADFIVMLNELPKCPWTADGFREWQSLNNGAVLARVWDITANAVAGQVQGALNLAAGQATGNVAQEANGLGQVMTGMTGTISEAMDLYKTVKSAQASGATVRGTGSYGPIFDVGQDSWGFKVTYLTPQNYIMRSIDQYFDRFGYRVNQLKKLELENRPIWTFIKTAECHVVSKTRGVPFISELAINNMFNHGVTMWKRDQYMGGHKIGDFSKAKENRGIAG